MSEYRRPVWAEIDLVAVERNIAAFRGLLTPGTMLMAITKANAYGHGAVPVSETALGAGADRLGVALIEEALELRQSGVKAPLHVLSPIPLDAADVAVAEDLIVTVCRREEAAMLSEAASKIGKMARVHIKVDTGMHRLGVYPDDVRAFAADVIGLEHVDLDGLYTHFAVADRPEESFTGEQFAKFTSACRGLSGLEGEEPLLHAANTAATIFAQEMHLQMVRIGIGMYGLHPSAATKERISLAPVLSWKARIAQVKQLRAGDGVSYGLTFRAAKDMTIAIVPVGYDDGYSRILSNRSDVLVNGRRASVVGTICMDLLMIDVTSIAGVDVGSEVVLIGRQGSSEISADEIARLSDTINYEVVCNIGARVPRVYVGK